MAGAGGGGSVGVGGGEVKAEVSRGNLELCTS